MALTLAWRNRLHEIECSQEAATVTLFASILVPLADEALVLAVRLATAVDLTVHVAHVAEARAKDETLAVQARYSDALHHEYRDRLEELIARAIPALTRDDCRRVRSAALGSGDVADELLRRMELDRISVLVVG